MVVSVAHRGERLPLPLPREPPNTRVSSPPPAKDIDTAPVAMPDASNPGQFAVGSNGPTAEEMVTSGCPLEFLQLIESCWAQDSRERPTFAEIERAIEGMPL